jgi:hypothetical protein
MMLRLTSDVGQRPVPQRHADRENPIFLLPTEEPVLGKGLSAFQNSKVDLVAADNPHDTPFVIHLLVGVAELERSQISSRTKEALEAAKRRAVKLGNPTFSPPSSRSMKPAKRLLPTETRDFARRSTKWWKRRG